MIPLKPLKPPLLLEFLSASKSFPLDAFPLSLSLLFLIVLCAPPVIETSGVSMMGSFGGRGNESWGNSGAEREDEARVREERLGKEREDGVVMEVVWAGLGFAGLSKTVI